MRLKAVLLGEPSSGKSTFFAHAMRRWCGADEYTATIGGVNGTLRIRENPAGDVCGIEPVRADDYAAGLPSEHTVSLWDTAGQERYYSLIPMYYRNATIAIVLHEGTAESKRRAATIIDDVRRKEPHTLIYVVQNKSDLVPEFDAAFVALVGPVAGSAHTCCTSDDDTSVRRALVEIARLIRAKAKATEAPESLRPSTPPTEARRRPCCRWG